MYLTFKVVIIPALAGGIFDVLLGEKFSTLEFFSVHKHDKLSLQRQRTNFWN